MERADWERVTRLKLDQLRVELERIDSLISLEMSRPIGVRRHHRLLLLLYREKIKYSFAIIQFEELLSIEG